MPRPSRITPSYGQLRHIHQNRLEPLTAHTRQCMSSPLNALPSSKHPPALLPHFWTICGKCFDICKLCLSWPPQYSTRAMKEKRERTCEGEEGPARKGGTLPSPLPSFNSPLRSSSAPPPPFLASSQILQITPRPVARHSLHWLPSSIPPVSVSPLLFFTFPKTHLGEGEERYG